MSDKDELLSHRLIKRIEDIGRIEMLLKQALDSDLFDDLSKHNPYWHDEGSGRSDKMYEVRCRLQFISETLWAAMEIIDRDYSP